MWRRGSHTLLSQAPWQHKRQQPQDGIWENLFRYRKKHFTLSVVTQWNGLSKEALKSPSLKLFIVGQFPEPPALTGFCSQRKVGLRDPWEVAGQDASPCGSDTQTSLRFCQQMAISAKLHLLFQPSSARYLSGKAIKCRGRQ